MPTSRVVRTRWVGALLLGLAVVGGSSCQAIHGDNGPFVVHPVTDEGADGYRYLRPAVAAIRVSPSPGNSGGNSRHLVVDPAATVRSLNQTECVTWRGPVEQLAQPGVALRIRNTNGRIRAVMVTNNILFGARNAFNVHIVDTASQEPLRFIGSFQPKGFAADHYAVPAAPWRLCARVVGRRLDVRVWAPRVHPEPAWGDPAFGGALTLPSTESVVGNTGVYIGHLAPRGTAQTFTENVGIALP